MSDTKRILLACTVVLTTLCAGARVVASPIDYETRMNILPPDIVAKMREAVHGDASGAYDLWWYFSIDMNDPKEAHFWIKLSAEQGLCAAEFQYAYELVYIYEDLNKAAYWLRKFDPATCPAVPRADDRVAKLWKRIESRSKHPANPPTTSRRTPSVSSV